MSQPPPRLSVIIPALNEGKTLPGLLAALAAQTRMPDEVIVADAGSRDDTVRVAREHGARVVPGGRPGPGRNAGARAAAGDLFLFLDADTLPRPDFVERLLDGFRHGGYDVGACLMEPMSDRLADRISTEAVNVYLQIIQSVSTHAPGCCILARRSVHEAIGGFDVSALLGEDHDYVQRAARVGRFGIVTGVRIPLSMRRLEAEGISQLALKYIWCEMHALAGKPIRSAPFKYEFGSYDRDAEGEVALTDIGGLRAELGRFDNPVQHLSAGGLERLERLFQQELSGTLASLSALDAPDLRTLYRYLHRRRALLRLTRRRGRARLAALQAAQPGEWLQLLDPRGRPGDDGGNGRPGKGPGEPAAPQAPGVGGQVLRR